MIPMWSTVCNRQFPNRQTANKRSSRAQKEGQQKRFSRGTAQQKENEQNKKKNTTMIITTVKEGENIERALKKFKRKYERTGVLKELRRRQFFNKPSMVKRADKMRAIYVQHTYHLDD